VHSRNQYAQLQAHGHSAQRTMPVIILPLPDILFISPQPRFMCSLLIIQNYSAGPASSVPQPVHERYGICTTSTTKTLLTNSGRRQVGAQKSFCRFKFPSSAVAVDGRPTHPSGIDSRTWTSLVPSSPLQMDACWSVQILWIRTPHQLNVCMPKSQAKIPSSRFGSRDLTPLQSPRIQIRTTRVLPRSLESSPAAHASNPRSDQHWLHLYRGVRYYDLNYSSPPFYNGRRFCPSPSSAPIVRSSNSNGAQSNLLGRNLVPFSCFVCLPSNLRGTTCDQDIIYHTPIPPVHSLHHFKTLRLLLEVSNYGFTTQACMHALAQ
jgi:hypothetical protein